VSSSAQGGAVAPVRFGLVGYGFGARYFHAPLIASATECQLVAVATRSAERRALVGGAVQLGRRPKLRVANGDEGEQVVSGPAGVVELGSVVRFVGVGQIGHGSALHGLIKGPAGVRLAASGPAFIDGLGHLVVKADRALQRPM
jgi:hypothetical protein